jgi:hypothetical protein
MPRGRKDFSEIIALAKTLPAATEIETGNHCGRLRPPAGPGPGRQGGGGREVGRHQEVLRHGGLRRPHEIPGVLHGIRREAAGGHGDPDGRLRQVPLQQAGLGDIGGIPRVLDAGQCNDCYSLAVIAMKLKEVFGWTTSTSCPSPSMFPGTSKKPSSSSWPCSTWGSRTSTWAPPCRDSCPPTWPKSWWKTSASLSPEVTLKLGRQELVYDNSRILGNVDWAQQGRSHDLALLKWNTGENARLHAGFAFNQEWEPLFFTYYSLNNYKTMQFLWYNNQWENTGLSLLFLNNGIQYNHDRTVFSQTTGARVTQNAGAASLAGSFYLQTGRDGSDRELRAWYLAAEAAFPLGEQFRGIAGFEFLSGTDYVDVLNPAGTVNRSFTPLYGTNHAFNGHMDYFYVGNHINNVGLINPYFTATTTQGRWTFTSTLHLFWADGDVHYPGNPNELMSPYLGTEIDLIAGYTINPEASIRFGYSHMFASETMERIKGGSKDEIAHWAWIMVILKPTIFSN